MVQNKILKLTEIQLMNQHFIEKFLSLKGVFAKNKREKIVKKRHIPKNAASIQIQKVARFDS